MRKTALSFLLALGFLCSSAYGKFEDEYLDKLLDDPETTLESQRATAANYKKATGKIFNPELLSLIGALARREYERTLPKNSQESNTSDIPELQEGHVELEHFLRAQRFEALYANVHRRLREVYGDKILENPVRVINNVGGIYAIMEIYYCGTKEYLALFGTLLEQTGYSGSYSFMNVFDIMVDKTMVSHGIHKNTTVPVSYGPDEISFLPRKERRIYWMEAGAIMIDVGQGFTLPGVVDGVLRPYRNNGDVRSLVDQLGQCAKSLFRFR